MKTPENPPVAVIILNWNGASLLREFLPAVIANTDPALGRVIVVDNGSDDDSRQVLATLFPDVQTILFDKNYGFAEGYNRAIAAIDTPYALLLNSDVAPAPGWLQPLYHFMQHTPDAAACQPKILSYKHPDTFEYAGAAGGFLDRHGYPYCRGRIFDRCETDHGQYDTTIPVDWASGAALLVRTHLYIKAGGLDPLFFAHMEEIDLCWRLRTLGYDIYCVPDSTVYHLGGASLPASNPRKTYLNFRNNLLMLHKNLPPSRRKPILLRRRLLDTIAWLKYTLTANWANARAILQAHRDFRRLRPTVPHQPTTNVDTTNVGTLNVGTLRRSVLKPAASPKRPNLDCSPSVLPPDTPNVGTPNVGTLRRSVLKPAASPERPKTTRPNILTAYYLRGRRTFSRL